jgi:hypothetical protein
MEPYFLLDQEIIVEPKLKSKPEVPFRSTVLSIQSGLVKPWSHKPLLEVFLRPSLKICFTVTVCKCFWEHLPYTRCLFSYIQDKSMICKVRTFGPDLVKFQVLAFYPAKTAKHISFIFSLRRRDLSWFLPTTPSPVTWKTQVFQFIYESSLLIWAKEKFFPVWTRWRFWTIFT